MNLIERVSEYLNVNPDKLKRLGIYDGYANIDSEVYISPKLLTKSGIKEFEHSEDKILKNFRNLIDLLKNVKKMDNSDLYWRMSKEYFSFPEPKGVALGTSIGSMDGNGLTGKTAESALEKLKKIVDSGINDPYVFQLLSVVQDNIGVDRVSDMIINIIYDDLLRYTEEMMKRLNITELETITYNEKDYKIKYRENGKPLILVPQEILGEIPTCASYADVQAAIDENQKVREELFKLFGKASAWQDMKKDELFKYMLENNLLLPTLRRTMEKDEVSYDFLYDNNGIHIPVERMQEVYLENSADFLKTLNNSLSLYEIVGILIEQFKFIIESKGLNEELYRDAVTKNGNKIKIPRKEITSHRLFIAILESLASIYDVDYTYEPKSGNGEVDFRFSRGKEVVIVEFKHNSHNKLVHGYVTQLTEYMKREKTNQAYYVIMKVSTNDTIEKFEQEVPTRDTNKKVIVIDGLLKSSPSHISDK